jgi:hypothetical protein
MKIVTSDQWFTPTPIIARIALSHGTHELFDYCTCPEAAFRSGDILPWFGDALALDDAQGLPGIQFCNPPYSKESGGAKVFVEKLMNRHEHNYFLLNYSNWIAQLVDEQDNGMLGLFDKRIKFDPSEAVKAQRVAAGKEPNATAPRYNNAILYFGPRMYAEYMPTVLGGYKVRWFV